MRWWRLLRSIEELCHRRVNLFHVLHAGNPGDQGAEDNQGDDHGYQADEGVAERLHRAWMAGLL